MERKVVRKGEMGGMMETPHCLRTTTSPPRVPSFPPTPSTFSAARHPQQLDTIPSTSRRLISLERLCPCTIRPRATSAPATLANANARTVSIHPAVRPPPRPSPSHPWGHVIIRLTTPPYSTLVGSRFKTRYDTIRFG